MPPNLTIIVLRSVLNGTFCITEAECKDSKPKIATEPLPSNS
jgi:hypothetical protein